MVWVSRLFDVNNEGIKPFAYLQSKFHRSQFSVTCGVTTACKKMVCGNLSCLTDDDGQVTKIRIHGWA